MDIPTIEKPIEEAKAEYEKYSKLLKSRHEKELELLKICNYHLKNGRKLIDIFQVLKHVGLDKNDDPKLAIARADWQIVDFTKQRYATGIFHSQMAIAKISGSGIFRPSTSKEEIRLPMKFYESEWKNQYANDPEKLRWDEFIPVRGTIEAPVPTIPASLRPDAELKNYYILFEVESWSEFLDDSGNTGRDPLLLKRLSNNLFVVLAAWDMTDLEKAVLDGIDLF